MVTPYYNDKSVVIGYKTKSKNFNINKVVKKTDKNELERIEECCRKYGNYILSQNFSDLIKKRFIHEEQKEIQYWKPQLKRYVFDIPEDFFIRGRNGLLFLTYENEIEMPEILSEYEDVIGNEKIIFISIQESLCNLLKNIPIEKVFNVVIPPYKKEPPEYDEQKYLQKGYYKYKDLKLPHGDKMEFVSKKGIKIFQEEFRNHIIEVSDYEMKYRKNHFFKKIETVERIINILTEIFSNTGNIYDYDVYIEKYSHHLLDICERGSVKDLLPPNKTTRYNSEQVKRIDGVNVLISTS